MRKLYCIYSNTLEDFKVIELTIKEEMEHIITFKYDRNLLLGQVSKEKLDKIMELKNGQGKVAFTFNELRLKKYINKMKHEEEENIKDIQRKMKVYKEKIRATTLMYK